MSHLNYRALIVDDEIAVRRLTMRSLSREGFRCDAVADGREARTLLESQHYELVVTDLRMPNANGHALVVHLLGLKNRPLIAVLTGVVEPRLAKDLIARGVDELMFKPVEYDLFAAKLKALVNRRISAQQSPAIIPAQEECTENPQESEAQLPGTIDSSALEAKLCNLSSVLPISQAALDVYNLTSHNDCPGCEIAAAIQLDASLAADVLRLANSSFYNPTAERISDIAEAVLRVGHQRVGELALATNALSALTAVMLPWINVGLVAQRSIAAGIAVECLIAEGGHRHIEKGLLIGAIMHSLGRVVLGTLFPECYDEMLTACRTTGDALAQRELQVFGQSQAAVMSRLLSNWGIPAEVFLPLKYVDDDYAALVCLSGPTRTKAELIKLGIVIGQIAIGTWEPWDLLELPSSSLLKQLRIESATDIIARVRLALKYTPTHFAEKLARPIPANSRRLTYYNLAGGPVDLMAQVLKTQGFQLRVSSADICEAAPPIVVNCLDAPLHRLEERVNTRSGTALTIVCPPKMSEQCSQFGAVARVPGAFGSLMTSIGHQQH